MGKEIKKNTYSIIVIILFILSIGFAATTFHFIGILTKPNQTYIGTIAISNYDENQYSNIIADNLYYWEENSKYKISYQNFDMSVDFSYFEADIDSTIDQLEENELNSVVYNLSAPDKLLFIQELSTLYTTDITDLIDEDKLIEDILNDIKIMSMINDYDLEDYFDEGVENTILSSITVNGLLPDDVNNITNNLTTLEIEPQARFYLLEHSQNLNITNNQLSIVASAIQSLTADSNLSSFIYEQNTELPSWGLEGMNVRILQTNGYDFSFYNDFDYSMTINITKNDNNSIVFELIGYPFVCEYSTTNIKVTDVDFGTIYEDNDTIDETTPGVITIETTEDYTYHLLSQIGINGKIIKFEKTITYPDASSQKIILYYEEYNSTDEVYQENVVPKGGE